MLPSGYVSSFRSWHNHLGIQPNLVCLRLTHCFLWQGDCILARNAANLVQAVREMFSAAEAFSVAVSWLGFSTDNYAIDLCECLVPKVYIFSEPSRIKSRGRIDRRKSVTFIMSTVRIKDYALEMKVCREPNSFLPLHVLWVFLQGSLEPREGNDLDRQVLELLTGWQHKLASYHVQQAQCEQVDDLGLRRMEIHNPPSLVKLADSWQTSCWWCAATKPFHAVVCFCMSQCENNCSTSQLWVALGSPIPTILTSVYPCIWIHSITTYMKSGGLVTFTFFCILHILHKCEIVIMCNIPYMKMYFFAFVRCRAFWSGCIYWH